MHRRLQPATDFLPACGQLSPDIVPGLFVAAATSALLRRADFSCDAVHHQHGRRRQLRIARTEIAAFARFQQLFLRVGRLRRVKIMWVWQDDKPFANWRCADESQATLELSRTTMSSLAPIEPAPVTKLLPVPHRSGSTGDNPPVVATSSVYLERLSLDW